MSVHGVKAVNLPNWEVEMLVNSMRHLLAKYKLALNEVQIGGRLGVSDPRI